MKRTIKVIVIIAVTFTTAFLLFMRYRVVALEGYPSWEAVRNMLIRDGEIVITFPDGVKPVIANCDDSSAVISINENTVTTKVGYTWCVITVHTEAKGSKITYQFDTQKLNNWNRIRFVPEDPSKIDSDFKKYENGIKQQHQKITREKTANLSLHQITRAMRPL